MKTDDIQVLFAEIILKHKLYEPDWLIEACAKITQRRLDGGRYLYFILRDENKLPVACSLVNIKDRLISVFVKPEHRRKGLGKQAILGLLKTYDINHRTVYAGDGSFDSSTTKKFFNSCGVLYYHNGDINIPLWLLNKIVKTGVVDIPSILICEHWEQRKNFPKEYVSNFDYKPYLRGKQVKQKRLGFNPQKMVRQYANQDLAVVFGPESGLFKTKDLVSIAYAVEEKEGELEKKKHRTVRLFSSLDEAVEYVSNDDYFAVYKVELKPRMFGMVFDPKHLEYFIKTPNVKNVLEYRTAYRIRSNMVFWDVVYYKPPSSDGGSNVIYAKNLANISLGISKVYENGNL